MKKLQEILKNKVDPTARGQRDQRGRRGPLVSAVSMNNEGHAFYTDYFKGDVKAVVAKMKKAVAALNKNVPGGTWTVTVDGQEV